MKRRKFLSISALSLVSTLALPRALAEEEPARKTIEGIVNPGQAVVEFSGEDPKIILIPILHPQKTEFAHTQDEQMKKIADTVKMYKEISFDLYDAKIADGLVFEGITKEGAEMYAKAKRIDLGDTQKRKNLFLSQLEELLNGRKWIIEGINRPWENPINEINFQHEQRFTETLAEWEKKGWLKSAETFSRNGNAAMQELQGLTNAYLAELENYYTKDPRGEKLYEEMIEKSENAFIDSALACIKKGAKRAEMILGANHEQGIRKLLEKDSIPYAVIRAKEMEYKPISREEALRNIREESAKFRAKFVIPLDDKQTIEITNNITKTKVYKAYISPGQK